jgi:hypothetical protein
MKKNVSDKFADAAFGAFEIQLNQMIDLGLRYDGERVVLLTIQGILMW